MSAYSKLPARIVVEGHELPGMQVLLLRNLTHLIGEGAASAVETYLRQLRCTYAECPGSPNRLFNANGTELGI